MIKAAQLPWQGDSDVERQWEIVGGHYVRKCLHCFLFLCSALISSLTLTTRSTTMNAIL